MIKLSKKSILIFLGLIFLVGNISTVEAAEPNQFASNLPSSFTDVSALDQYDIHCGIPNPLSTTNYKVVDCIPYITYYVLYKPASFFFIGTGYIFDKMLDLSINKDMVAPPFIGSTWVVVRDFSNMIFIFILLYTGIMTMFGEANWRKTVLQVVLIALLINFSLFFTKVVIDAGNVLAIGIRSAISPGHSVSESMANSFQPQYFLSTAGGVDPLDATIVFIVAAVISGYAGYIFFKVALLFAGRLIAFWVLMIMSPFAFISITLPKGNKFNEWLGTLLDQAFVAPTFLFFIYIILRVLSEGQGILSGFAQTGGSSPTWFQTLIGPIIVATLLLIALQKALSYAKDTSGAFGQLGSDMISKPLGLAAMVATGGTAMLGRQVVGRGAAMALKGGLAKEGTMAGSAAKWATRASFDVRNAGAASKGFGTLGIDAGKGGGVGGRAAAEEKRVKAEIKTAEGKKVSIFTEQGIRARAEKEAGSVKQKAELEAAEKFAGAAKDLTAQLQKQAEAAQAEYDKPVKEAEGAYAESQKSFEKYKGTEHEPLYQKAMDEAKDKIASAKITQSSQPTSAALKSTIAKLDAAKKAEAEALEKVGELSLSVAERTKKAVGELNKAAIETHAKKVGSGYLSLSGGYTMARHATADKIRKGSGEKNWQELLKEAAEKKVAEEEKKKEGSSH